MDRHLHHRDTHPGLFLDKYAETYLPDAREVKFSEDVQKPVVDALTKMAKQPPNGLSMEQLLEQRMTSLSTINAHTWTATTVGPLTLHLARGSTLENAGICLHPMYGFVYLPGTGLKGMAHSYASEVWMATQDDKTKAWNQICEVFGWAPSPWLNDLANRHEMQPPKGSASGQVVFHDAWPTTWPKLIVDILNNHHSKYYQEGEAPGDWESPVPVYFLAIGPNQGFSFAISPRRYDTLEELQHLACEWLLGALTHEGAGAKTASGYGYFQINSDVEQLCQKKANATWEAAKAKEARAEFNSVLELVTPAFLAGATQSDKEGCDLRPSTLRGQLRWWWRAMHSGFVSVDVLRKMEALIWGDTEEGGAVRIVIEHDPNSPPVVIPCPLKQIGTNRRDQAVLETNRGFLWKNNIPEGPRFSTQPLLYMAYGMDEMRTGDESSRKLRNCVLPGAQWRVRLIARKAKFDGREISASSLLDQAKVAMWWFCRLGGAGSRSRKGFGSFRDPTEFDNEGFEGGRYSSKGEQFRTKECKLPMTEFDPNLAESPSLKQMSILGRSLNLSQSGYPWVDQLTSWTNPWYAIDKLGDAAQKFAQAQKKTGHGKHCPAKRNLGLPRKIHGPLPRPLNHQKHWTPPQELEGVYGDRFASPVFYHVGKSHQNTLLVRVAAFPTSHLRESDRIPHHVALQENEDVLSKLLIHHRDFFASK